MGAESGETSSRVALLTFYCAWREVVVVGRWSWDSSWVLGLDERGRLMYYCILQMVSRRAVGDRRRGSWGFANDCQLD